MYQNLRAELCSATGIVILTFKNIASLLKTILNELVWSSGHTGVEGVLRYPQTRKFPNTAPVCASQADELVRLPSRLQLRFW